MIKVSVIVPVYNAEMYLTQCLDSLVNQTIDSKEIIIVNDGSTDNSLEIALKYEREYDFVKVINKKNGGGSSAQNVGIKNAGGEYILYVDSDDFIDLDSLEYLYDTAYHWNLDIVKGKYYVYYEDSKSISRKSEKQKIPSENKVISGDIYLKEAIDAGCYEVVSCINLYRRSYLLENNLLFPEGICYDDHENTLRCLIEFKNRIMQTDRLFYYYRQRSGSMTKSPDIRKAFDIVCVIDLMLKFIKSSNLDKETHSYALKAVSSTFYQLTCLCGRLKFKELYKVRRALSKDIIQVVKTYSINRYVKIKNNLFIYLPILIYFYYKLKRSRFR